MKQNYTELEYLSAKSNDLLSCLCVNCNKPFNVPKKMIIYELKHKIGFNKYCSRQCQYINRTTTEIVICKSCGKSIKKEQSQMKKVSNHFCSSSCAATYNNAHKVIGTRRSKLENYLETKLIESYPTLEIHFNRKDTINSELDIYIPSLKLAFELNGIFHYEPIYGQDKLSSIQNNDNRKFQACLEQGTEICLIDTSSQIYFKEESSIKFLTIITEIINKKLLTLLESNQ